MISLPQSRQDAKSGVLGDDIMVGAALQPRAELLVLEQFAAGKPLPQRYFKF